MFVDESDNLTSRAGLEPLSTTSSHPTLPCNWCECSCMFICTDYSAWQLPRWFRCRPVFCSTVLSEVTASFSIQVSKIDWKCKVAFFCRYGPDHPIFFVGSFEDALKESLHCKARDVRLRLDSRVSKVQFLLLKALLGFNSQRRLLAIYLHHDGSILTNVFCSQILCSTAIREYFGQHFVMWAWDVTLERNKAK